MIKRNDISILGKKYFPDILNSLLKSPKRFVDLCKICPNEKTRTAALKKLEQIGLVGTISLKLNERYFVHYKITNRGKEVAKILLDLKKIMSNK